MATGSPVVQAHPWPVHGAGVGVGPCGLHPTDDGVQVPGPPGAAPAFAQQSSVLSPQGLFVPVVQAQPTPGREGSVQTGSGVGVGAEAVAVGAAAVAVGAPAVAVGAAAVAVGAAAFVGTAVGCGPPGQVSACGAPGRDRRLAGNLFVRRRETAQVLRDPVGLIVGEVSKSC